MTDGILRHSVRIFGTCSLVVCLYQVVYGRLMDAKTWPLFGLYILRFIHYQKVFIPALIVVATHIFIAVPYRIGRLVNLGLFLALHLSATKH